jgi:hypothetical protein
LSLSKKTSGNSHVLNKDVELDSIIFVLDPVKSTNDRMEHGSNLPGDNAVNEPGWICISLPSITCGPSIVQIRKL